MRVNISFIILVLLFLAGTGCKKSIISPVQPEPPVIVPVTPKPATPQAFRNDCKLAHVFTKSGLYTDSMVYVYEQDKPVKISYYYNNVLTHDILISYPLEGMLRYQVFRKQYETFLIANGTATLEGGLIRQIREEGYNSFSVYNMEYTSEGQLLRIRTGEPSQGLMNLQDFEYKDGNLVKVYNSLMDYTVIEYDHEMMQPELADRFIPLSFRVADVKQVFPAFYRQGWLGKKSKNMPTKVIQYISGQTSIIDTYNYKRNTEGNIVYFTKQSESPAIPQLNYTGFTSIDYFCK